MMEYFKKSYKILDNNEKLTFFFISLLNFLVIFLELLGISIIFPVVSILVEPESIYKFSDFFFFRYIENLTHLELLTKTLLLLIIFYLIKTIIIILISYIKSKKLLELNASISQKMFSGYINQEISLTIPSNSAYITRNIIDFPSAFTNKVLLGIFTIFSEAIFVLGVFFIFINLNTLIGLSITVLTFFFIFIFSFFNLKNLNKFGKTLNDQYAKRVKVAREAIEGLKDISLLNKQDFYNEIYINENSKIIDLTAMFELRAILPRYLLEFFTITLISLSMLILLYSGVSVSEIFPLISILAAGLLKLIPSISKILSFSQRIKSHENTIDTIYNEATKFKKIDQNINALKSFENEIEIKNLSFRYPTTENILQNVNFTIKKNTMFGIKGVSGAGKSTCLNLISGFLNPTSGMILSDGHDIFDNIYNWQKLLGLIPQKVFISDDTLISNICLGVKKKDIDENLLRNIIKISKIDQFADINKGDFDKIVGERGSNLSAGQIQRIGLARTLYKKPKIIILDEVTSALDKITENEIFNDIKKLKSEITIIVVSHDEKIMSMCDDFYDLSK